MNGLFKKVPLVLLIATAVVLQVNAAEQPRTRTRVVRTRKTPGKDISSQVTAAKVTKNSSTVTLILEQTDIILKATGTSARADRIEAKAEINRLMTNLKKSSPKIYNAIKNYVDDILAFARAPESREKAQEAFNYLMANQAAIEVESNYAKVIAQATDDINNAPVGQKQEVAAQAAQDVADAEKEVEDVSYYNRAKGYVTGVFFDEETKQLTNAFYIAAGAAAIGAGYLGYAYRGEIAGAGKAAYAAVPKTWEEAKAVPGKAWGSTTAAAGAAWKYAKEAPSRVSRSVMGREAAEGQEATPSLWQRFKTGIGYGVTVKEVDETAKQLKDQQPNNPLVEKLNQQTEDLKEQEQP
jgi:hypothetical protein